MALSNTIIKNKLASAPAQQKDNVAQTLIAQASAAELNRLDAEGVLRLVQALVLSTPRYYSDRDKAAMTKLAANSQFKPVTNTPEFGVNLIKQSRPAQAIIQSQLSAGVVKRIYAAEKSRLSTLEWMGIDGDTIGRGQLGQPAYTDVKSPRYFESALRQCVTRVILSSLLSDSKRHTVKTSFFELNTYGVLIPGIYKDMVSFPALEDCVVAGYLGYRIINASKTGRSAKDTLRFAVALYHGMRSMVVAAQTAVKDEINWAPVEAELINQNHTDEVAYVNEVVL